jgi:hypothetical protein
VAAQDRARLTGPRALRPQRGRDRYDLVAVLTRRRQSGRARSA